jgi:hypothetical protein
VQQHTSVQPRKGCVAVYLSTPRRAQHTQVCVATQSESTARPVQQNTLAHPVHALQYAFSGTCKQCCFGKLYMLLSPEFKHTSGTRTWAGCAQSQSASATCSAVQKKGLGMVFRTPGSASALHSSEAAMCSSNKLQYMLQLPRC